MVTLIGSGNVLHWLLTNYLVHDEGFTPSLTEWQLAQINRTIVHFELFSKLILN
jgi:hypothetical protein